MPQPGTIVKNLLRWYEREARDLPWRKGNDPYAIWISEIMLQQTQVKTVIPYWNRWMARLPDLASLASARETEVLKLWEGLGYYSRAKNLQKAAQAIEAHHGGVFPRDFDALLALPGIGPYTAGAIASIAFGMARPVVDGNVIRVLTRVDGIGESTKLGKTIRQIWDRSGALVERAASVKDPRRNVCGDFNQSLMELGATVCLPKNPCCRVCPLLRLCRARMDDRVDDIPNLGKRKESRARQFLAVVILRSGRYLVRQRRADGINGSLWEFPNTELTADDPRGMEWLERQMGLEVGGLESLGEVKHSITNNRITLKVFCAEVAGRFRYRQENTKWLRPKELDRLPFTAAHRRILNRITAH